LGEAVPETGRSINTLGTRFNMFLRNTKLVKENIAGEVENPKKLAEKKAFPPANDINGEVFSLEIPPKKPADTLIKVEREPR
jgi:hypothetical protein